MLRLDVPHLPQIELPPELEWVPVPWRIGWIDPPEAHCLYWMAQGNDGAILEIGCREGSTTFCLASFFPERQIYGLDYSAGTTMLPEQQNEQSGEIGKHADFMPNVRIYDTNSRTLDYSIFPERVSTIFIDGDHSYEGVKRDTELALAYLQAQNHPFSIVWHDYGDKAPSWVGVNRYLNTLGQSLPIRHVRGTQMAIMRGKGSD